MATIERKEVEDYLKQHSLEDAINEVINSIVKDKPVDPYVVLADMLKQRSQAQKGILSLKASEVLDPRGMPAIEVTLTSNKGIFRAATAAKLTGVDPADPPECRRDGVEERFCGMGVTQVVDAINSVIAPALLGKDPKEQQKLDELVVQAAQPADEGEPPLGNDVLLAVSMAVCKAGASDLGVPLHEHIAGLAGNSGDNTSIPVPMFNMINGGLHAGSPNYIQELLVMPVGAASIAEACELGYTVQEALREKLVGMNPANVNTGMSGGFAPQLGAEEALELVAGVLEEAGLAEKMKICVDMAASRLRERPPTKEEKGGEGDEGGEDGEEEEEDDEEEDDDEEGEKKDEGDEEEEQIVQYDLAQFEAGAGGVEAAEGAGAEGGEAQSSTKDSDDLIDMYKRWVAKFPIISIEDPFDRQDWDSFFRLKSALEDRGGEGEEDEAEAEEAGDGDGDGEGEATAGAAEPLPPVGGDEACVFQIVGDELLAGAEEISKANEENQVNTMALELGKRPTVSQNIAVCSQAQEQGWSVVVSARPGETTDTFLVDFAVGMQAGQIKVGGMLHAEHTDKYNQLLRLAASVVPPPYAGPNFRMKDSIEA
eukprot:g2164.t1